MTAVASPLRPQLLRVAAVWGTTVLTTKTLARGESLVLGEGARHEVELDGSLLDALGEVALVEREAQLAVLEHVVRARFVVSPPGRVHVKVWVVLARGC